MKKKSQFEKDLEKQVRTEVRAIMSKLTYGYEYEMSDYAGSTEQEKRIERVGKAQVKRAEDALVKLALEMY